MLMSVQPALVLLTLAQLHHFCIRGNSVSWCQLVSVTFAISSNCTGSVGTIRLVVKTT